MHPLLDQAHLPSQPTLQATLSQQHRVGVSTPRGESFQTILNQTSAPGPSTHHRVVQPGDTLVGLIRDWHRTRGAEVSDEQAYRQALQVARSQGIENPNLIRPGQRIRLDGLIIEELPQTAQRVQAAPTTATVLHRGERSVGSSPHSILDKTLERAQAKGYIPAHEVHSVRRRIVEMAQQFGFQPDDFARVALMESDGFNPEANNGRCFGVIQFCSGRGQGADSVGMVDRPKDILRMSVLQQLDLVETYFKDTGLDRMGSRIGLADLYLTVLTPAARQERRWHQPLDIVGDQANLLYVGGRRGADITRHSIVQGLNTLTSQRLGLEPSQPQRQLSSTQRQQFAAALASVKP